MNLRFLAITMIVLQFAGCTAPSGEQLSESEPNGAAGGNATSSDATNAPNERAPVEKSTARLDESALLTAGTSLDSALAILDSAGYRTEDGWQWGSTDPDTKFTWRKISDGIEIAITYSDKSHLITSIAMMYIPPKPDRKGNYRVVAAEEIFFNPDGTYVVKFAKPEPLNGG